MNIIKLQINNINQLSIQLTVIVSTVRVLLLTVCVEIISPSAVYPGLFSPRTTLTPPGIVSNVCDTVVDVSGFACEFKLNIPIEMKWDFKFCFVSVDFRINLNFCCLIFNY